jgi:hypothetical protein
MYNTKYECRYYKDDVFLETDDVTDDEKEFIRNVLYREDLLNIFSIAENDDSDVFDHVISQLCKQIKNCVELSECMRLSAAKLMSENEEMGLCILYSYDYMYLTHKCVSSYLENGLITQADFQLLKNQLQQS